MGKFAKYKQTSTQCINTTYEKPILKEIEKWIKKYYSLSLEEFSVDKNFFKDENFKYH